MKVKALRKLVLLQLSEDAEDKSAKKRFKKAVQSLEATNKLTLNDEGLIKLKKSETSKYLEKKKSKKRKLEGKSKGDNDDEEEDKNVSSKQKKSEEGSEESAGAAAGFTIDTEKRQEEANDGATEDHADDSNDTADDVNKNVPCKGNPTGVTRLFIGNLPFKVDEASLRDFLPGECTHIKWITDKETGRFYGSAFIEMRNSKDAADAMGINGAELMGRKLKLNYAPAREGDVWPPRNSVITGGQAQSKGTKSMSEKPEGCMKLFIGNLSYDIDEDGIHKFFGNVDAEVKAVRWLHHRDTGDFKGVGFVEFWSTEACEKAASLNGKNLLGRPIRIDWTD